MQDKPAGPMNEASSNTPGKPLGTMLITGAAKRVGAQVVRTWHREGGNVLFTYRGSADDARTLAGELNGLRKNSVRAVQADILDTKCLPGLVQQTVDTFGSLDLLLNNASTFYPTPLGEINEENWDDLIGTNLKAPLFLIQAAAPHLREAHGSLINMVDIHARKPLARHFVYCAAKAGLSMLTMGMTRELGPQVRVNAIAPGPIMWPEVGQPEALKQQIVNNTALKRSGDPTDIASLVLYLVRDATFITGQIIAVDGGRSVGW